MVLLSMLSAVADSIKSRPVAEKAIIDQTTFRAHYKLTLAILFACSIMATAFNLFGKFLILIYILKYNYSIKKKPLL